MVTVRTYTDQVSLRGVNQQTRQGSSNSFGLYIGEGLQALSKGINSAAEALDFRDSLKAEADARNAANRYREALRSGLYDPQTGYLMQTGENALGQARGATFDSLQAVRSDIESSLSPRARNTFSKMVDDLDNSAKDTAIKYEGTQFREFTMNSFAAASQGYLDDAMRYAGDEVKFNQSVDAAARELVNAALLEGVSDEVIQARLDDLTSTAHAGRVIEFARTDPVAAYEYLKSHRETINQEQYGKLLEGLEPAYYAASARDWVSQQSVSFEAANPNGEDAYGVPYWLGGNESSWNPNAKNELSTAGGVVQFLEGTYLSYVEKLKPAWAEGLTREEILATRSDRAKEGEIYRAMRKDNQRMLANAGMDITPRNEYLMHHLGPAAAKTLIILENAQQTNTSLRIALETAGVNADQFIAANPWMEGQTVGSTMDWFENKVGAHGGVSSPVLMMESAVEISDPQLRAAVMRELELRSTVANNTRNEEQRIAREQAWDVIDNGGDPSMIPPELQAAVGANTMNEIFNAYERNVVGVDVTDEARHLELIDMATTNPTAFAELDLNADRANLSRGDLLALKEMQTEIASDLKTINEQGQSALIYDDADYRQAATDAQLQYEAAVGTDMSKFTADDKRQYVRFTQQLRTAMRTFADTNGRQMTFEERTNLVNSLLAPTLIRGVDLQTGLGKGTFLFDVPVLARDGFEPQVEDSMVPAGDHRRITESLTTQFGRAPTSDEIVEQYENELLMSLGISPALEYKEIPEDIRRRFSDEYPHASPEDIVDMYLQLTIAAASSLDTGSL